MAIFCFVRLFVKSLQPGPPSHIFCYILVHFHEVLAYRAPEGLLGVMRQSLFFALRPSQYQKSLRVLILLFFNQSLNFCNRSNAEHSVLMEALNLIIHLGESCNDEISKNASSILGGFVSSKEANIRYLGLKSKSIFTKSKTYYNFVFLFSY